MFMQADFDGETEEAETQVTFGGREGILFAIDTSATMLEENESKECNLRTALEAIEAAMKNLVVGNQKDLVGVIFYNTIQSPRSKFEADSVEIVVPKNMSIILPMDAPSVDSISYVNNFYTSDDLMDFHNKYGCCNDATFSDVLWLCTRMFQKCGYKLQSSAIVVFTDNPLPHAANSHEYNQAMVRAKDLSQLNVEFSLIPMQENFDGTLFYREFICTAMDMDLDHFQLDTFVRDIETISNRIYRRNYRKRCNNYLKFTVGDGVDISVGLYSSIRHTKYPKSISVHRDTNELIIKKRVQEVYNEIEDAPMPLLPNQQKKYQEIGGKKVIFTTGEIATMKTLLPAGIKLLGFKPRAAVAAHHFLKNGYFIYPDEVRIEGSTQLFRALWQRCLEREKVPICIMTLRQKSNPTYVALLPQENISNDQEQIEYNGFLVIHLPNVDDVRDFDTFKPETVPEITPENVELYEKVIKKLKFKYSPKQFDDPALKNIYSNIEAFAFKTDGEQVEDTTLPDVERQDQKIADLVTAVNAEFGEITIESGSKRKTASTENGASRKVPRYTDEITEDQILAEFRAGREEQLTIKVLKGYLQQIGVSGVSAAKKSILIDKIRAYHNL
ncbi:ATP-dependent DNA helicase 2 subunit 1 [Sergentomyia squamirostris]